MKELDTDIRNGLSSREIHLKKRLFGDNQLQQATRVSPLGIFFSQFNDFITIVLIVATTIQRCLEKLLMYCNICYCSNERYFRVYSGIQN